MMILRFTAFTVNMILFLIVLYETYTGKRKIDPAAFAFVVLYWIMTILAILN